MASDPMQIDPALLAESSHTMPPERPRKTRRRARDQDDDDNGDAEEDKEEEKYGDEDEDEDPIVATYNVLMKPSKQASHHLHIIEAPNQLNPTNRDRAAAGGAAAPLELRMKPATGMFEVDYPLDYNSGAYDRAKGLNWGAALQKSTEAKKGGSHGLAGGFGVGAPPMRAPRGPRANDGIDYGMDWTEALRRDMVLRTQTLGGQTPDAGAESGYMVAVFAGGNLHLTSASSLIHLRPHPHYIDAAAEQERIARGAPLNAGAAGGGGPPAKEAARAIHMTVKQTADGEAELVQETMADRLKKVQAETWRKMRYVHDESADAWAMSEQVLYAAADATVDHRPEKGTATATAAASDDDEESGAAQAQAHDAAGLVEQVASLGTGWREEKMLETTSGIENPEGTVKVEISDDEGPAASKAKGKGKGKAATAAAAATTTTGTRGKRAATATTATTTATESEDKGAAEAGPSAAVTNPTRGNKTAKAGPSAKAKKSKS